jgi:DNA-binding NtrC family response regulator
VSENRILLVLGPAATLYLITDAFVRAGLDGIDAWVATVAVLSSFGPYFIRGVDRDETRGKARFNWLAESMALALAASLGGDERHAILEAVLVALVGSLVVDLAFTVPDRPSRYRRLRVVSYAAAALVAVLGGIARAETFELLGELILLPVRFEKLPELALLGFGVVALVARLLRRSLGSTPSALAANAWATAGLFFAVPLLAVEPALDLLATSELDPRIAGAARSIAALILLASHAAMIDPRRRPVAEESIRTIVSIAIPLSLAAALGGALAALSGAPPLTYAATAALLVFGARVLETRMRGPVRRILAPRAGRLLDAVERTIAGIERRSELEDLAETALVALRERPMGASPWFMIDDPDLVFRVDAAGLLRRERRPVPLSLFEALRGADGGPILLRDFEARIVREPAYRGLVEEMNGLDAHTAIPLTGDGELQGALLLTPRASAEPPTLEELTALSRLGAVLGARLVSVKSAMRAQRRLHEAIEAREAEEERVEALREELTRRSRERASGDADTKEPEIVAYSKAMRLVTGRLESLASTAQHVVFVAEPGSQCERLAYELHQKTHAGDDAPFLSVDCTLPSPDESLEALLGRVGADGRPGWLLAARGGTLFLADIPALPKEAQHELAEALSQKRVRPLESSASHEVDLRIIASSPVSIERLVHTGAFDRELARWLGPAAVRIPPLRERVDDLPSLTWMAIARACRALGRESVGISEEAMEVLRAYEWPGNERELHRVIRLAVSAAQGQAILPAHLPPLGKPQASGDPLEGTHAEVERRLFERALARAGGNKSEAAKLLDMKRSTFIDRLRRLGIDA